MAQTRIINYGETFTQQLHKLNNQNMFPIGVYAGLDMVVVSVNSFALSPGSVLMPNGVLVVEDTNVAFAPFIPLPAIATTLTVKVIHEDANLIGGQAAIYSVVGGLSPAGVNEVVIGYIRHPGSGAPFSVGMWVPTVKLRADLQIAQTTAFAPTYLLTPFQAKELIGLNVTQALISDPANGMIEEKFSGNGLILPIGADSLITLQVIARASRPRKIQFKANMPVNNSIAVVLSDPTGIPVAVSGSPFAGTGAMTQYTGTVGTAGSFPSGSTYLLTLTVKVQALTDTFLGPVTIINDPLA